MTLHKRQETKDKRQGVVILSLITCLLLPVTVFADDCLSYKITPQIKLTTPKWRRDVVQPLTQMDYMHGNVIATLSENFDITGDTIMVEDSVCVVLKSIDAEFGYSDFQVNIDSRHIRNSCTYNAILSHEDEHIRAYLSVVDDMDADIKSAIQMAADSIMPVFVGIGGRASDTLDELHRRLESHPEIILIRQKIRAEQELRNKRIDNHNKNIDFNECFH